MELGIRIGELISLDLGRSFVGLMNTSSKSFFNIDLMNWKLTCGNSSQLGYTWNCLVPIYQCQWPVSIVLNTMFHDKCSLVFGLLFPLKISKVRLNNVYLMIGLLKNMRIDPRKIIMFNHLRVYFLHIVNSLLGYAYDDVLQKEWQGFNDRFKEISDFDELRKIITNLIDSLLM